MNILGINYAFHDASACLIQEGEIVAAVEEERLNRNKHTQSFPYKSIDECLQIASLAYTELDHIAVSTNPGLADGQKYTYALSLNGSVGQFLDYEFERLKQRNLAFMNWFKSRWPALSKRPEVHFVDHHLAHAAGTYFVGPWDKAALLSIDGWGEWSTTWSGYAEGASITMYNENVFPNSLGSFYSAATEFCGFKPNYDEGKTMGLAPLGDSQKYYDQVDSMIYVDDDANVKIDLSWFEYQKFTGKLCGDRFYRAFGTPRESDGEIFNRHKDVAAAFQSVLEKNVLKIARTLQKKSKANHLIYSGGVALNSVANGRIIKEGIFDDIFLMPGAGDNGTAIGAAAFTHSKTLGNNKRIRHSTPYLGTTYSDDQIEQALIKAKIPYCKVDNISHQVAEALFEGQIVGWFQGRMEFGPRSLGGRSILADPTKPEMRNKINSEVKHRESFRPFAPSVTVEHVRNYFDIAVEVPYMLKVADVKPDMQNQLPAIVHVDGTARIQTVSADISPEYHEMISAFGRLSGHPVVLNTSFNVMGEPIVESPLDAIRCFYSTGLDLLAIGSFLVSKSRAVTGASQRVPLCVVP